MNDNPSKEAFLLALDQMSDKLVELGYATRVHRDDTTEAMTVWWTPLGLTMRREMGRMFAGPKIGQGEVTLNLLAVQTLLTLFLRTNTGVEGADGHG